jgi:hypothetical protein
MHPVLLMGMGSRACLSVAVGCRGRRICIAVSQAAEKLPFLSFGGSKRLYRLLKKAVFICTV